MSNKVKIILASLVAVILLGGFGVWYFVFRDDAPPKASLAAIDASAQGPTTTSSHGSSSSSGSDDGSSAALDGTWKVQQGQDVFVGYRVLELFAGDRIKKTAAGRTAAVNGTMTIAGTTVDKVDITADVTKLKSDQARRDSAIANRGLQTSQFPQATFTLTKPITLPSTAKGKEIDVTAVGNLTLHGRTKPVNVELQAELDGNVVKVAGSTPITFADYGIEPIEVPGFVKTDDHGSMELQLVFTK
jgi:polyisoprenoid-binding protein YceI